MGIVGEIQKAVKDLLPGITGNTQIDYEYAIDLNSERGYTDRFGFYPGAATLAEGRAIGFTTTNHIFTLLLTDDFTNKDCDVAQNDALLELYEKSQNVLKDIQKSRLALPTPGNQVLLISGLTHDDPEFSDDNHIVALRTSFTIQYRYKNN